MSKIAILLANIFAPFLRFPLDYWISEVVCLQPILRTGDDLKKLFCLRCALQFCLTFALAHPEDGIIRIRVDGLIRESLLPSQSQGMDNRQKLSDIIRAVNRTIMEHTSPRLQIDGLIFHRSGITRTGCIYSPCVCPHLWRQGQYGVMSVIWGILHIVLLSCSPLLSYILSGTSMPRRPMPLLMILATFLASIRRTAFFCSSGSLRIEKSW